MSRNRSSAYWAGNRYADEAVEPLPTAPLHDLPAAAAGRFKALRTGLAALDGVAEAVRFMGTSWRWAWEYGVGNRKLCWVHVIGNALSATFTMSDSEEDRLSRAGRVPADGAGCRSTTAVLWRRFSGWPRARRSGWGSARRPIGPRSCGPGAGPRVGPTIPSKAVGMAS